MKAPLVQQERLARMQRRIDNAKLAEDYARRAVDAAVANYGNARSESTEASMALSHVKSRLTAKGYDLECGDEAPVGKSRCALTIGHDGHHKSEDGSEGWP